MIGNFQIATITETALINLDYTVSILEWADIPESAMFTANGAKKRYLTSLGNSYKFVIKITNIPSANISTYTDLNGTNINFLMDITDTMTLKCTCEVEPIRADGISLYNGVIFTIETIQPSYQTDQRQIAPKPFQGLDSNGEIFWLSYLDSTGNTGLLTQEEN